MSGTRMAWAWDEIAYTKAKPDELRYSEDQPRDEDGRFGSGGGAATDSAKVQAAASGNTDVAHMMAGVPTNNARTPEDEAAKAAWVAANAGVENPVGEIADNKLTGAEEELQLLQAWSGEDSSLISRTADSKSPEELQARLAANPLDRNAENSLEMQHLLDNAPVIQGELYRGASVSPDIKVGAEFNLPPSSFSISEEVAQNHAVLGERMPGVVEVRGGSQGIPVQGLSKYPEEQEIISAGHFVVQSVEPRTFNAYGKEVPYTHIVVTQTENKV